MSDPVADLDQLERLVVHAEMAALVLEADLAGGMVPPGAVRPLFPWEVASRTNFAAIAGALNAAQSSTQASLDTARDEVLRELAHVVESAPSAEAAAAALAEFAATAPPAVQAALKAATAEISTTLEHLYASGANLLIKEAEGQGVGFAAKLLGAIAADPGQFTAAASAGPSVLWSKISSAAVAVGGSRAAAVVDVLSAANGASIDAAYDVARQATNVTIGEGRAAAAAVLPTPVAVYASELLDGATCGPCSEIDGYEYVSAEQAYLDYPDAGPYVRCDGEDRCRGTLVFSYEESDGTADGADPNWDTSVQDGLPEALPGMPEPAPSWSRPAPSPSGLPSAGMDEDVEQLVLPPFAPKPAPAPEAPAPAPKSVDRALRGKTVDQLAEELDAAYNADDNDAIEKLEKELDRRDRSARTVEATRVRRAAAKEAEAGRIQALIDAGEEPHIAVEIVTGRTVEAQMRTEVLADLRNNGYSIARNFDDATKMRFRDLVAEQIVDIEEYTRGGSMLNAAGRRAGVSEDRLFFGSEAFARRYASPELAEYWDTHRRLTLESLRSELLGGQRTDRGIGDFLQ